MSRVAIAAAYVAARWRARTLHGAALQQWQDRRGQALVEFVRARSAFYRALWADAPATAWRDFPLTDKRAMMQHFDDFTTIGVSRDIAMSTALRAETDRDFSQTVSGCTVGLSSGTSGHRGLFLVSEAEQSRWAGTILARAIPDLRPGHRVAFFLRANSRLYERTGQVVQFRFFDLMQPLPAVIEALNAFQPQLIVGPPSLLGLLADAQRVGTLRVAPSRLISVAEVIEPQDRARLSETFQAPVGEVYQCTEGLLAVSCAAGSLHVQEDVVLLQYEPLPGADSSRVTPVVTDLWRRVQPIVRYRLGDVLRLDHAACACGSRWQRVAAIEGRQDDLCWFPQDHDTLRVVFADTIRRMILLSHDGIAEYLAEQDAPGTLQIAVELTPGTSFDAVDRALRRHVHDTLASYGCHAVSVTVVSGVPVAPAGAKRRRVRCTWRRDGTAAHSATQP